MKTPIPSIFRFQHHSASLRLPSLGQTLDLVPSHKALPRWFSAFSFFLALLLLAAPAAFADTTTSAWSGTTNSTWSTAGNWGVNGVPSTTVSALFDGTFSNQPTLTANQTTQGIWLATGDAQDVTINSAAAQVLTIQGGAILNGQTAAGIYMNDSANHNLTIGPNTSITLSANTGFYNQQAGGTLTISGGLNLGVKTLTIGAGATSTGNVTINSAITGTGVTAVGVNTAGTVTLSGNNTYTGSTAISGGAGTLILRTCEISRHF